MSWIAAHVGRGGQPLNIAALVGLGAVLTLLAVVGTPVTHSTVVNTLWSAQFSALLQEGVAYPRWLPDAFGGLGSPTFIYYAPLPFYLLAAIDMVTVGWLDPAQLVGVGCAILLVCSAATMRFWLRPRIGSRGALLGGIAYACAPYHLFDAFVRGSLGELAAYAILPLLMAALVAVLRCRPWGVPSLALCAGGLLLSHLPTALFVGGLLVPAYIIWFLVQRRRQPAELVVPLIHTTLGGFLGLGLAAVYVIPALSLLGMARMDYFTGGYYDARQWLLLTPSTWEWMGLYGLVLSLILSSSVVALAKIFGGLVSERQEEDGLFWSLVIILFAVLISGAIPWIWEPSSPLSRIEFPWRMLLVVEFSAVYLISKILVQESHARRRIVMGIAMILSAPAVGVLIGSTAFAYFVRFTKQEWIQVEKEMFNVMPDAIEYLPAGHPFTFEGRSSPTWSEMLELVHTARDRGGIWLDPPYGSVSMMRTGPRGEATIDVEASSPVTVVFRRFYYPLWRLEAEGGTDTPELRPHSADRLLSFSAPVGSTRWRLIWAPPMPLHIGARVSAVAALTILALAVVGGVRRHRRERRTVTQAA